MDGCKLGSCVSLPSLAATPDPWLEHETYAAEQNFWRVMHRRFIAIQTTLDRSQENFWAVITTRVQLLAPNKSTGKKLVPYRPGSRCALRGRYSNGLSKLLVKREV